ncbi:hybrid sensor histidine kinase/response regulator [Chitinophaga flava]|uniref:histidine kinase n=1 Tax=Chitinophaga flava TaxID=2259036 RepID=A0A365XQU2_9BACT|nr:ATP-binding protein [Chitinophaga flava]RBL88498.1 hypothetical protein DF182_18125 [Chitinophaga flava]
MFQALLKSIKSLTQAGTAGLSEEEHKKVRIINTLSLLTGSLAISIGTIFYLFTDLLGILIPANLEGICFLSIIYFNSKRRYKAASISMLVLYCLTTLYFDIILGQVINLTLICVFLFCLTLFLYSSKLLQIVGFTATVLTIIAMELNFYFQVFPPYELSMRNQFIFRWVALACFLSFIAIIIVFYVRDRRAWYNKLKNYSQSLEDTVLQLKQANQSKRIYLRETNHEIRTPLNAILGIGQLLETKVASQAATNQELGEIMELVTHLNSSSIFAKNIVNNVLELSRIESGIKENVHKVIFPVNTWISELVQMHRYLAQSQKVDLILQVEDDCLSGKVNTDKIKLTQIVTNILSNAIKFSPKNGEVKISVYRQINDFFIKIKDQGIGISKSQQEIIFDPFVTNGNGFIEGTGLGLYIARQMVLLLNGTLELESKEGEGTTFTIRFIEMLENISLEHTPQPENELCNLINKKVLLIDDDTMSRMILYRYFKAAGCQLVEAVNGKEGLTKARSERPDFIVLDTQMPVMDGRETLKNIRQDINLRHIPVIITTADSFAESRHEMMNAGATEFVAKPIEFQVLHQTLSRVIQ